MCNFRDNKRFKGENCGEHGYHIPLTACTCMRTASPPVFPPPMPLPRCTRMPGARVHLAVIHAQLKRWPTGWHAPNGACLATVVVIACFNILAAMGENNIPLLLVLLRERTILKQNAGEKQTERDSLTVFGRLFHRYVTASSDMILGGKMLFFICWNTCIFVWRSFQGYSGVWKTYTA